ncbi:MAG TPA: hypothetical protein PLM79_08625 [Syntrophobacteraceae bacterium]|nr:hypothetical protein [Syntrophobacteraceae bacterium]
MRLRFLREGNSFGIICAHEQLDRMLKVIRHNGGSGSIQRRGRDAVYVRVSKGPEPSSRPGPAPS